MDNDKTVHVLSIDAWRNGPAAGDWTWNNWHKVGTVDVGTIDAWGWPVRARRVLAWARREGYLGSRSIGRCVVQDDGYNVVIAARGTGEPLFAIEYGAVE